MKDNNFKRLLREDMQRFNEVPDDIESNIRGSVGMFQYISQVVELYLPGIFDIFLRFMGKEDDKNDQHTMTPKERDNRGPSSDY